MKIVNIVAQKRLEMTQNAACLHVDEHRLSVPLRWNNNCCVKPAPWENFGESIQRCVCGLDPSGVGWQRGQACAHTCYSVDELAGGLLHSYSTASHRRFVLKWQRARSFIISFAAPVMENGCSYNCIVLREVLCGGFVRRLSVCLWAFVLIFCIWIQVPF